MDIRHSTPPLPPGMKSWYERKMSQAREAKNPAQKQVLEAYSRYLLRGLDK